jgi:hypothetical protein
VAKFGTIPYLFSGGNSIKLKNAQLIIQKKSQTLWLLPIGHLKGFNKF